MNQKKTNAGIPQEVERFNIIFRIQHIILFVTFLLLSFTGWGLKYADVNVSSWWIRIWGGPEVAGIIHRIAGVTMCIDFGWHVLYLIYLVIKGDLKFNTRTTLIPLPKDVFDAVQNFMYFLGLSRTKPKFAKFSYAHKFDYWAVFWGMFIIGGSGLALAFPIATTTFIPSWASGWIWQLLGIMHSDEALLAIVFILFFHFYNEHLKFDVFPMSWLWLTGKISTEELKHKHPLEYEMLFPEDKKHEKGA
jgi:cytochrome b subunit of formate dehydrogenase